MNHGYYLSLVVHFYPSLGVGIPAGNKDTSVLPLEEL